MKKTLDWIELAKSAMCDQNLTMLCVGTHFCATSCYEVDIADAKNVLIWTRSPLVVSAYVATSYGTALVLVPMTVSLKPPRARSTTTTHKMQVELSALRLFSHALPISITHRLRFCSYTASPSVAVRVVQPAAHLRRYWPARLTAWTFALSFGVSPASSLGPLVGT